MRKTFLLVFGLSMGPAVALGLARLSYALLLPRMRADLGWSYEAAGALNTANAIGYLAGALVAAPIGKRIGERALFALGVFVTAAAVGAIGLATNFWLLMLLRLIAGLTGAFALVAGASLASAAANAHAGKASTLLGLYFAGAGVGIALSALVVPPLLTAVGWRTSWFALGGASLAVGALAAFALRRAPEPPRTSIDGNAAGWSPLRMPSALIGYALFGAGYIAYATFIVAYVRNDPSFAHVSIATLWALLGAAAIVSGFAWGPLLQRLRGGLGASATTAVVAVGAGLPLVAQDAGGVYLSAILFGGGFLSVPTAVTVFARRTLPAHAWTAAIAAFTVCFGLGQCIGPILSGALSDGPGGVRAGLLLSVAILAAGAFVAALQREPRSANP
jgi:predicted MFS family arabinose efflux permease